MKTIKNSDKDNSWPPNKAKASRVPVDLPVFRVGARDDELSRFSGGVVKVFQWSQLCRGARSKNKTANNSLEIRLTRLDATELVPPSICNARQGTDARARRIVGR